MRTQAIVFDDINTVRLHDITLRDPAPDEMVIETAFSCISPGTELRCLRGKQAGLGFPIVPGYTSSGRVLVSDAENTLPPGTRVACTSGSKDTGSLKPGWGGHVRHAIVAKENVYALPDSVDLRMGGLIRLAGIALHGVRVARPQPSESVLVIGLGIIGQLSARLFRQAGANVLAIDQSAGRVETARADGIRAEVSTGSLPSGIEGNEQPGFSIIADATGNPQIMASAIDSLRSIAWRQDPGPANRYLVQGSYEEGAFIPYQKAFMREVSVLFTRDAQPDDYTEVIRLLKNRDLAIEDLISFSASPADCQSAYDRLSEAGCAAATGVFAWNA